jgi:hypothetical protein
MRSSAPAPSFVSRRKPLAACVAAIFALSAPAAMAATWTVNTCSEANSGSGTTGSLRYAVANAASGDTVDMSGLTCSTISLQTGAITIAQASLTLNGPGIDKLTITGKYGGHVETGRIFTHTGTGLLYIENLSIAHGYYVNPTGVARGGCIYSAGSVSLNGVDAYSCEVHTDSGVAAGGAIYAKSRLQLKYSILSGNAAIGGANGVATGGGAQTSGAFTAKYSTISNNYAVGVSGNNTGFGGGLNLGGKVTIIGSTISANISGNNQGGIDIFGSSPASLTTTITNSTISGNSATNFTGGMYVNSGTVVLQNSTIASNTAGKGRVGTTAPFSYYAPGVTTSDSRGPMNVTLQSSLIANNTFGSSDEYDLSVPKRASTTVTFSGANNLVRATFAGVPSDTIRLSCPLLGPLRNNGGPTNTLALLSRSPGIDQGNNAANLNYDQRGSPYARVSGTSADIGAYEVQQADIIFNNGFDGCPTLF